MGYYDIKIAFREGMKKGPPKWLKKPRSLKAELYAQFRRLGGFDTYYRNKWWY